jgi:hypothetical protein
MTDSTLHLYINNGWYEWPPYNITWRHRWELEVEIYSFLTSDVDMSGRSDDLKSTNTGKYTCMSFWCTLHLYPYIDTDNA